MTARVFVSLKPTVLDPQGQTIRKALNAHGHPEVSPKSVKANTSISPSPTQSQPIRRATTVETIARDILANPVIENYRIEFVESD